MSEKTPGQVLYEAEHARPPRTGRRHVQRGPWAQRSEILREAFEKLAAMKTEGSK